MAIDIEGLDKLLDHLDFKHVDFGNGKSAGLYEIEDSACGRRVEIVRLDANVPYALHRHRYVDADFTFIRGEGTLILGEKEILYHSGMQVQIQRGIVHGFITGTATYFLSDQNKSIIDRKSGELDLEYV
jgi:mannose-6-phosphate isomerase-like protein (cupin superfamily)